MLDAILKVFRRKPIPPPQPIVTIGVPSDKWLEWMLETLLGENVVIDELEAKDRNEEVDKIRPRHDG